MGTSINKPCYYSYYHFYGKGKVVKNIIRAEGCKARSLGGRQKIYKQTMRLNFSVQRGLSDFSLLSSQFSCDLLRKGLERENVYNLCEYP